ncbi:hypothetical protein N7495_003121 [Penicillium taxi]|uniref:uncharacterized protein n=1 Tax=Penicillium taxi TaxID=168475 RepID=UPI002545494F|nr:uncharacterized protein N7495_003121 [Penicillium taxi]KAJ5902593.1 hypothetical protein N7495_003121 [Penicillium taxi]
MLYLASWLALLPLLLLSLLSSVHAVSKNLVPTTWSENFPPCGLSCSTLYAAQDTCLENTDSSTWVTCFCSSSRISTLKTNGSVCESVCTTSSEQEVLSQWYVNYCNSDGKDTGAATTTTKTTSSATATSTSSSTSTGSSLSSSSSDTGKSWWDSHYRWIIMLIVLVFGFAALAVLGAWLKRRYDAKHPGLYHAAGTGANDSNAALPNAIRIVNPGPVSWGRSAARAQSDLQSTTMAQVVPDSLASSSRTEVASSGDNRVNTGSTLQKLPQSVSDVQIRSVSRG